MGLNHLSQKYMQNNAMSLCREYMQFIKLNWFAKDPQGVFPQGLIQNGVGIENWGMFGDLCLKQEHIWQLVELKHHTQVFEIYSISETNLHNNAQFWLHIPR